MSPHHSAAEAQEPGGDSSAMGGLLDSLVRVLTNGSPRSAVAKTARPQDPPSANRDGTASSRLAPHLAGKQRTRGRV
jgi:hypothetical protein